MIAAPEWLRMIMPVLSRMWLTGRTAGIARWVNTILPSDTLPSSRSASPRSSSVSCRCPAVIDSLPPSCAHRSPGRCPRAAVPVPAAQPSPTESKPARDQGPELPWWAACAVRDQRRLLYLDDGLAAQVRFVRLLAAARAEQPLGPD